VAEVVRRAPAAWNTEILLLRNVEAGIPIPSASRVVVSGWSRGTRRLPPLARRVFERRTLRRELDTRVIRAVLHYGTYVPIRPAPPAYNVLHFVSMSPWDNVDRSQRLRNELLRWLFERSRHLADLIVVQSRATRDFMESRYPDISSKLAVVTNGVAVPALERPKDATGFVVLGDIYGYRRIDDVVAAYARLDAGTRAAHPMMIAGNDRRDRAAVRRITRVIKDNGLTTVHLLGQVPRDHALALLARSHAYVSYATVENGPNALVEATAIGVRSILSDLAVHREVAGPTALYVRGRTELTEAMAAAAGDGNASEGKWTAAVDTWDDHLHDIGRLLVAAGALDAAVGL
jgi:glycosyltransferase involved in cell wall biosynthesis